MKKHLFLWFIAVFTSSVISAQFDRPREISKNNEFGGKTIEYLSSDYSRYREYFDLDGAKVKEEQIFSEDYPIVNGLEKLILYYYFDKKVKEEKVFTSDQSRLTMIKRSIEHYNRFTGKMLRKEEHFIRDHMGYNMVHYVKGRKDRIVWYFPNNAKGIVKTISFIDHNGKDYKTINYYSHKTTLETGYFKRIYHKEYTHNKYHRKTRQEWYYSDEFSQANDNIYLKSVQYTYPENRDTMEKVYFFDKSGKIVRTHDQ